MDHTLVMTYSVLFVVVAEDGESSVLSELCRLDNHGVVDRLQHYHSLRIAWTNLRRQNQQNHLSAHIPQPSPVSLRRCCTFGPRSPSKQGLAHDG